MNNPKARLTFMALLFMLVIAGNIQAQIPTDSELISISMLHPVYSEESKSIRIYNINMNIPNPAGYDLYIQLPYIAAKQKWWDQLEMRSYNFEHSTCGNPAIGFQSLLQYSDFTFGMTIRMPVVSDDDYGTAYSARYADLYNYEAYVPDYYSIKPRFNFAKYFADFYHINLDISPTLWLDNGESVELEDSYFSLNYRGQLLFDDDIIEIALGLSGIHFFNSARLIGSSYDNLSFDSSFGVYFSKHIKGGVFARVPLTDRLQNELEVSYGFGLSYIS